MVFEMFEIHGNHGSLDSGLEIRVWGEDGVMIKASITVCIGLSSDNKFFETENAKNIELE